MTRVEAVAEALASMDKRIPEFMRERSNPEERGGGGCYELYLAEAAELIKRIRARGYEVVGTTAKEDLPHKQINWGKLSKL